jgi:hypothetical protein
MGAAPKTGPFLSVMACWLIVAASGDDFNFARLVLPSLFGEGTSLPLDDPNTDFDGTVNEARSSFPQRGQERPDTVGVLPSTLCHGGENLSQVPKVLVVSGGAGPRLQLNPPLLC